MHSPDQLQHLNQRMAALPAPERIALALQQLPAAHVASTSFGAQSAAFLHLWQQAAPGLPVIFVDTGFLFAQTYAFAETLQSLLKINLRQVRVDPAKAWREQDVARLEHAPLSAIEAYNHTHKVAPMQSALQDLGAQTWLAGLRRVQSNSRAELPFVSLQNGRIKVHPLADWTDRDIGRYLSKYKLPYHPLWDEGYVSIGDRYLTRALEPGESAEQARFFGRKRECGLHEEHSELGANVTPVWQSLAAART